jgi:hypothetical protein
MHTILIRRIAMMSLALPVLITFMAIVMTAGPIGSAQLVFVSGGLLFGFIVLRLVHTMLTADRRHSRCAHRALIVASVIPALVLVPSVLDTSACVNVMESRRLRPWRSCLHLAGA